MCDVCKKMLDVVEPSGGVEYTDVWAMDADDVESAIASLLFALWRAGELTTADNLSRGGGFMTQLTPRWVPIFR